jgi:hypothetical protein
MGSFPNDLCTREAVQTLGCLIDKDITQVVRIFHEDGGGHVVDDGVDKTSVVRLIARFTPGHGFMRSKLSAGVRHRFLLLTHAARSKLAGYGRPCADP